MEKNQEIVNQKKKKKLNKMVRESHSEKTAIELRPKKLFIQWSREEQRESLMHRPSSKKDKFSLVK